MNTIQRMTLCAIALGGMGARGWAQEPEAPPAPDRPLFNQDALNLMQRPAPATPVQAENDREVIEMPPALVPTHQEDRISIALEDVELLHVVRMFTRISNANIIANPTNLVGTVTVNLNDVPWQPALESILQSHNLFMFETPPGSGIFAIERRRPDAPEPLEVETIFLNFASVTEVQSALGPVLAPEARLSLFPSRNALVIKTTPSNLEEILRVIGQIDSMREQVFIEAKFMELNDDAIQNLGVNWESLRGVGLSVGGIQWAYAKDRERERGSDRVDIMTDVFTSDRTFWNYDTFGHDDRRSYEARDNRAFASDGTPIVQQELQLVPDPNNPGMFVGQLVDVPTTLTDRRTRTDTQYRRGTDRDYRTQDSQLQSMEYQARDLYQRTSQDMRTAVLGMSDFNLVLSALRETEGVSVVSNPKIIVANEEKATIHIGQTERPFISTVTPATESSAPFTTYNPGEPVEFGVKLEVTPTVNTASNISLLIEPTLTRFLRDAVAPTGQTYPIIARKTISTRFTLEDGKTVAIGGLTETADSDRVSKVPLLGDLPLIGRYLFTHTRKARRQTETIIFVTVGMASPDRIRREEGLPEDTRLVQPHMMRREIERHQRQQVHGQMRTATDQAIESMREDAADDPALGEEIRRIFGK